MDTVAFLHFLVRLDLYNSVECSECSWYPSSSYFIPETMPNIYLILKNFWTFVLIFLWYPLKKSTKSTGSSFESQHRVCFLIFYTKNYSNIPKHNYFSNIKINSIPWVFWAVRAAPILAILGLLSVGVIKMAPWKRSRTMFDAACKFFVESIDFFSIFWIS